MLITFTWRPPPGQEPPGRVYLHVEGVHDHHRPELHHMDRVGDHWESTVEVPDDLTASYRIMPVPRQRVHGVTGPAGGEADTRTRWRTLVTLTVPHRLDHPAWRPASFTGASGRLIMPDAQERPGWNEDDQPDWDRRRLDDRDLWTAGLTDADRILVLSDGASWSLTALPAALRRLGERGILPFFGVVAVDTAVRRRELLSRASAYRTLIADRVIPWAWSQTGEDVDPRHTVIGGESLGGLSALDLVLERPDAVTSAVCNSGSFWFPGWDVVAPGGVMAEEIRSRATTGVLPDIAVYLSVGTGEGRPGVGKTTMVDHSRAVRDALVDAGIPVTLRTGTHGHEMAGWTGALTRGLVHLSGAAGTRRAVN